MFLQRLAALSFKGKKNVVVTLIHTDMNGVRLMSFDVLGCACKVYANLSLSFL